MDCQAINRDEWAEKYLHHRLDAAQMDEFETHVLGCARCARELELLQAVQTDLTERAHEIRGWTASKSHFFRWQVVVLAGIIIAVGTVSILVRWQKMQSASITAPPLPQANPSAGETVAKGHEANTAGDAAKTLESQTASPDGTELQVAHVKTPKQMEHLPTNSPSDKKYKLKNQPGAGQDGTQVESAAANEVSGTRQNTSPSGAEQDLGKVLDNAQNAPRESQQVTVANSQQGAETARAQPQLTTEQGVELYKMAAVVPPPYTFSGLASKGKLPNAHDKGKYSAGSTPSDTGRQLFQNAMAAYVDKRYGEAAGFLESAVQNEPKAADINFYLGACKLLLHHPQDSIAPLKRTAAAGNSPYLQSSHYYLSKAYLQEEKFEEAEGELRNAAAISGPLTTEAKSLLARTQALRAQLDKH